MQACMECSLSDTVAGVLAFSLADLADIQDAVASGLSRSELDNASLSELIASALGINRTDTVSERVAESVRANPMARNTDSLSDAESNSDLPSPLVTAP